MSLDTIIKDIGKRLRALESREHTGATNSPVQRYYSENYGAVTNGVTDDRDAIDRVANTVIAGDGRIIVTGSQVIGANLTIPTNVALEFKSGSLWTVNNGITVTINGPIQAGMYQIFNCVGTGVVAFGGGNAREIYCAWWGLVGDGATDDSPAINAALVAAETGISNVYLGEGDYGIDSTLFVDNRTSFRGSSSVGTARTILRATDAITIISMTRYCDVSHFYMIGEDHTDPNNVGIYFGTSTNNPNQASHIYFGTGFYYCIYSNKELDTASIIFCQAFSVVGRAVVYLEALGAVQSGVLTIRKNHFNNSDGDPGEGRYGIYVHGFDALSIDSNIVNGFDYCVYVDGLTEGGWVGSLRRLHSEERRAWVEVGTAARWQDNHLYAEDDIIIPTAANANGWAYQAQNAGLSAVGVGNEPVWTGVMTYGATIVDNAVTWEAVGGSRAITVGANVREFDIQDVVSDNHIVALHNYSHARVTVISWHSFGPHDLSLYQDANYNSGIAYYILLNFNVGGTANIDNGTRKIHVISNYSQLTGATLFGEYDWGTVETDVIVDGDISAGSAPDPNAILTLASTTKAFLMPRMTAVQRAAIAAPVNGMMVYDTTNNAIYGYENGAWVNI